jgi:hypothetical protein
MGVLHETIAEAQDPELASTEENIFGTRDPESIAAIIERLCREQLSDEVCGAEFYKISVGAVIGLSLASHRDVVVKAYQRRWRPSFLAGVQRVQRTVGVELPCARPISPPVLLTPGGDRYAVVESCLPDPGMEPLTSPSALRVSAHGLARQIALCEGLPEAEALRGHPLRRPPDGLYSEPHSLHFDFDASSVGAKWIDGLARRAVEISDEDASGEVVGHTDWSARNVRFDEERLLAVYDWDSVAFARESTVVGQAGIVWRVTSEPGGLDFPDIEEFAAYLDEYQAASGRPLTARQRRAAGAAAVYLLAYIARCEHALIFAGSRTSTPCPGTDRLGESADDLLSL